MVAVIGCPAQSQFREVASTHDDGVLLIGHVHQYLCALAGLGILVGHVVQFRILSDIAEMLGNGLGYADFAHGDAECLHQFQRIIIGTVCGAETWHRDTNDAATVKLQLVESLNRH